MSGLQPGRPSLAYSSRKSLLSSSNCLKGNVDFLKEWVPGQEPGWPSLAHSSRESLPSLMNYFTFLYKMLISLRNGSPPVLPSLAQYSSRKALFAFLEESINILKENTDFFRNASPMVRFGCPESLIWASRPMWHCGALREAYVLRGSLSPRS